VSISASDHIEIQRLMYRYARCADSKDYAGFAAVFCADAVFDYLGTEVVSLAAIQQMMRVLDDYERTLHQVHNTLYEVEDDTATGETYCIASHLRAQGERTAKLDMGICYRDQLRRTSDGWRIAHRRFDLLWTQTTFVDGLVGEK
jgi:ketosteroid isomerase-like protein